MMSQYISASSCLRMVIQPTHAAEIIRQTTRTATTVQAHQGSP
ncbi:Uncharacterised protein [Mycobacteroides abscessus subsp. abscessus]|nr:Uncharacterised protein [Mycobacteroides abscessus subsp. abscessus]